MNSKIAEKRKKTKSLALCAIMAALTVLILLLGSVLDVLDLSSGAVASLLIVLAVMELGCGKACLIWIVASVLSLLLLPNKSPAVFYAMFAGCYPILKSFFEKTKPVLAWTVKMVVFNIALVLLIVVAKYVLMMPEDDVGFTLPIIILGNVTFVLYDIAVTKLVTLYQLKLRKTLKIERIFKM